MLTPAPAIPPMPTTEPTARRGNGSDVIVKTLADEPWCAEAASPMSATATQMFEVCETNTIGTTQSAQPNMAVLRAALIVHPRLMSVEESQPPPTLPTSAARYITTRG